MASIVCYFAALLMLIVGHELGSSQANFLKRFPENVLPSDQGEQKPFDTHGIQRLRFLEPHGFLSAMKPKIKDTPVWHCISANCCLSCFDVSHNNICVMANITPEGLDVYGLLEREEFLATSVACDSSLRIHSVKHLPEMNVFVLWFRQVTLDKDSASVNVTVAYVFKGAWMTYWLGTVKVHL